MGIIKGPASSGQRASAAPAASGSRALLKNGAPATVPEEEEGYLPQNPAPAPAPAAATKPNVPAGFEDDEGYLPQPAPAPVAPKPASSVPAGFEDDEGYLPQPAAGGNQPTPAPAPATAPGPSAQAGGIDSFPASHSPPAASNATGGASAAAAAGGTKPDQQSASGSRKKKPQLWKTKLLECSGDAASGSELACCIFGCCHCAAARAKSELDGTSALYNCLCWNTMSSYQWMRLTLQSRNKDPDVAESLCGEEMMSIVFCAPCVGRRMMAEMRLRNAQKLSSPDTAAVAPSPSANAPAPAAIPNDGSNPPPAGGAAAPASAAAEEEETPKSPWKEPLCGCTCPGGFLQSQCCFPCAATETLYFLHDDAEQVDCCYSCLGYAVNCGCNMYGQVRHRYGLERRCPCKGGFGDFAEDVMLPCALWPFTLNNALREARAHKGA